MTIKCDQCKTPVVAWDESGVTHAKCEKCGAVMHILGSNEKLIDDDQWVTPVPPLNTPKQIIAYLRKYIQNTIGDDDISAEESRAFKLIDKKMGYKTIFTGE